MITEDYVGFETAKLLKERGFDEGCSFVVNAISKGAMSVSWPTTNSDIEDEKASFIALPTLQMAMKWLREVHNLFIQICIIPHTTVTIEQKYYFFTIHKDRRTLAFRKDFPMEYYFTYEEACEAAIKYCLENLI